MPDIDQVGSQKRECPDGGAGQPSSKAQKAGGLVIADDDWENDCEAAFLLAVPPTWTFQECRPGQPPGASKPFPTEENSALNAMAARGQSKGSVKLAGNEFTVDMNLMIAVPADRRHGLRKMKKVLRKVNLNKHTLKETYSKYATEMPPPKDHPGGPDGIKEDGFMEFFTDIDVDPATDIAALGFSAACDASEMGVCRRKEFICGCAKLQVDNVTDLREKMPEIRENILSGKTLRDVYAYTFGIAIEPPSKVLQIEEAQQYWALLLPNWKLREDFCSWVEINVKNKAINRDLWMQMLRFAQEVPPDLSTFDESETWPVILDDFVEHYRKKKGL